jgi:branched-chain amino acid transport system ATP-binding protein
MVDELSLGLAPMVVDRLMGMVRRINEAGTTVILVEQSLNRALSLADRCFFMERGEILFDGPTTELMGRDDLLRPVFLGTASSGLGSGSEPGSG